MLLLSLKKTCRQRREFQPTNEHEPKKIASYNCIYAHGLSIERTSQRRGKVQKNGGSDGRLPGQGADVNAKLEGGRTPLDVAIIQNKSETADLLRKHGGKTGEELKAEGK